MSNLRLKDHTWDAANVYDSTLGKTQAEINEEVSVLLPSGVDQAQAIVAKLTTDGICQLGKGDFYVSNVVMPACSKLCGCGEATKLHFVDGASGNMVTMGDRCTVENIALYGDSSEIALDGNIPGVFYDGSESNLWTLGDIDLPNTSGKGIKQFFLDTPLLPGTYKISVNMATTEDTPSNGYIAFSTSQETGSSGGPLIVDSNIVAKINCPKNVQTEAIFTITETVYAVRICSTQNTSNTFESHWTNIKLLKDASTRKNSGICWAGSSVQFGAIIGCRFYRFDVAGLLMMDTGTPVDHNLAVSDCFFSGNNCGIYIRKNSEYNVFSNCVIVNNYYGVLNRGGNNYFANCGFNKNYIGMQVDQDEGGNGGHGSVVSSSFNHSAPDNTGYGIIVRDTGRMKFGSCTIGYSKVLLKNTNGNNFCQCGFGDATVEINGGQFSLFTNCLFRASTDTITAINNSVARAINCFLRGTGVAVDIVTE